MEKEQEKARAVAEKLQEQQRKAHLGDERTPGAASSGELPRGQKAARSSDDRDGDATMGEEPEEPGERRPRVAGFDDDIGENNMIASLLEFGDEQMVADIYAVLDEVDFFGQKLGPCLNQPAEIGPMS